MAAKSTNNRKTNSRKSNAAAKNTTKRNSRSTPKNTTRNTQQQIQMDEGLHKEVVIFISLAVCILMGLSNVGLGGLAGETVSSLMFGTFGRISYIIPVIVFGIVIFAISNNGNRHAYVKIAAAIALSVGFMALLGLINVDYSEQNTFWDYYSLSATHKNAGGLIGGNLIAFLCPMVGVLGTYVIVISLIIVCTILITEKSLLVPLSKGSKIAIEGAKKTQTAFMAKSREFHENHEKKRAYKAIQPRKSRKKVYGVSFATTLDTESFKKSKSPEVKELLPEDIPEIEEKIPTDEVFKELVINRPEEQPETVPASNADTVSEEIPVETPEIIEDELLDDIDVDAQDMLDDFEFDPAVEESMALIENVETEEIPASFVDEPVLDGSGMSRRKTKASAQVVAAETDQVAAQVRSKEESCGKKYQKPPISYLKKGKKTGGDSDAHLRATAQKLEQTLQNFGVGVRVTNASCGPSVTRYEIQPDQGVKVSKIVGLADDIKLNLAVTDLRIEAPIPGKAAVGIEVPNNENTAVMLRDLLESDEFKYSSSQLSFAVGKDIAGKTVVADIAKMPHLLVAGATGSGKSVCINTLIMSIIFKSSPENVKMIMIDPKVVELSVYNGIPHLLIPVVTDPKKAAGALNWAVCEMEKRYKLFAEYNVRDLKGFNDKAERMKDEDGAPAKMPQIIIIVDELADLMMVAPGEVENAICRLAQLARAAGLHLILATQRPSVNVITGLIKANMPSRIAFSVSSGVDSRTIIDMNGAEKLLGKGDMLFYPTGYPKPVRVQGSFVSDNEVQKVVDFLIKHNGNASYSNEIEERVNSSMAGGASGPNGMNSSGNDKDTYFAEAGKLIIEKDRASIGMLQRMFKIGFNRAARIMDQLALAGVVGEEEGTKPRKILMTAEEFEKYLSDNN